MPRGPRGHTGKERRPRRGANRRCGVGASKIDAAVSELVQVGRDDLTRVSIRVAEHPGVQVIGDEQQDSASMSLVNAVKKMAVRPMAAIIVRPLVWLGSNTGFGERTY